jgi:hypothetical protein
MICYADAERMPWYGIIYTPCTVPYQYFVVFIPMPHMLETHCCHKATRAFPQGPLQGYT